MTPLMSFDNFSFKKFIRKYWHLNLRIDIDIQIQTLPVTPFKPPREVKLSSIYHIFQTFHFQ